MRENWPGVLITALYLLASLVYNVTTPLWEAPDEVGHFGYILHIVQHKSLPQMEIGQLGEAHQPPLYYLLGALFVIPVDLSDPTGMWRPNPRFIWSGGGREPNIGLHSEEEYRWPYRGWALALHLVRFFSSLLGAGTVWLVYQIARYVFKERTLSALAACVVAFNPQFLFITASANNDNLLTFAATGLLLYSLDLQRRIVRGDSVPLPRWLGLGGWIWAIVLTKLTGLAVAGVAVFSLLLVGWRQGRLSQTIRGLILALLLVVLGTSWWWVRNWRLYGDPLGWKMYQQVFAVNLRSTPLSLSDYPALFRTQYHSFWGVFGWMTIRAPSWFYQLTTWAVSLALLGWLVQVLIRRVRRYNVSSLLYLGTVILAQEGFLIAIVQRSNESMWQGRYLFPAIAPIAIFLAGGWAGWAPQKLRPILASVAGLLGIGVSIFLATNVIQNAYLASLTPEAVSIPNPTSVQFGEGFRLRGHRVEQRLGQITVVLYWEALQQPDFDYSVFVHLMQGETLIGQRDHPPGSDRAHPPTTWQPGELVIDPHPVPVPLNFSGKVEIRVGVYNWMTGERLPVIENGQPVGDWVQVSETSIEVPSAVLLMGGILLSVGVIALGGGFWVCRTRHMHRRSRA